MDGSSATVGQTITLGIPKRFGLHLHRNTWTLDLTNLDANGYVGGDTTGDANCWRAGDHSSAQGTAGTGRDTLFGVKLTADRSAFNSFYSIPVTASQSERDDAMIGVLWNTIFQGDQRVDPSNPYSAPARLEWGNFSLGTVPDTRIQNGSSKQPIGGYPGFYVSPAGKLEWKGPIMCTFQTVVEKFSNNSKGWLFSGSLAGTGASGFPFPLYVSDIPNLKDELPGAGGAFSNLSPAAGGVVLRTDGISRRLARNNAGTSGGWKDDHLLEVHPLGIGGKEDPVRLVFDATLGPALNVCLLDLGHRFRFVLNEVTAVAHPALPQLPVARAVWECQPDFKTACAAWIYAGGAHHTVYSYAVTTEMLEDFAEIAGVELVVIDSSTRLRSFRSELRRDEMAFRGTSSGEY